MKKIVALLMMLALLIPAAIPALAGCDHAGTTNTWQEPTGVKFDPIDNEKHLITYTISEISTCTACGDLLSFEDVDEEYEEEAHQFDPETNYCNTCAYTKNAVKPSKVVLSESGTVVLPMGEALALDYKFMPEGAFAAVKWSTSSKKVATVDANGVVTPVKEGTATITIKTANGKKDTVKVKVIDPYKPEKIVLDQSGTIGLNIDQTLALGYALSPETARTEVKWSTSSKKIATVDENGVVTPVKEGTATITIKTANGKKDTVKVKVIDPYKPNKISIAHGQSKLETGSAFQMQVKLLPETAKTTLTWKSSNTKVAKVDADGNVTLVGAGSATITAKTHNGKSAKVKLTVSEKAEVYVTSSGEKFHLEHCPTIQDSKKITGLTVKKAQAKKYEPCKVCNPENVYIIEPTKVALSVGSNVKMESGKTLLLEYKVMPDVAQTTLTWKSSKTSVATVNDEGLVTAVGKGTATITVTTHNGKKATVKVSVSEAPAPEITNPVGAKELSGYLGKPFSNLKKVVSGLEAEQGGKDGYITKEFYRTSGDMMAFWGFISTGDFKNPDSITGGWKKDCVYALQTKMSGHALHGFYVGMPERDIEAQASKLGYSEVNASGDVYRTYDLSGKKVGDVNYSMMVFAKNGSVYAVRIYALKDGYWCL